MWHASTVGGRPNHAQVALSGSTDVVAVVAAVAAAGGSTVPLAPDGAAATAIASASGGSASFNIASLAALLRQALRPFEYKLPSP